MRTSLGRRGNIVADIFRTALQVEDPWELTHIEFDDDDQSWHLFIDFERGSTFSCPLCGTSCKAYDTEKKTWRHLDFWDGKTFMHARVPRTDCQECEKITLVPVKWSRPKSHFTLLLNRRPCD